jgi:hypothetical protein
MTYAASARETYVSIRVIVLVVFVSLFAGIYAGAIAAAWLLALGYPLKYSAIPASLVAAVTWLYAMRQWWMTVKQLEADGFELAANRGIHTEPLVIEHRTPTSGGVTTQRVKCPLTIDQLRLAAQILLPMDGRFNLRSMYPIMGQATAVEFRDWLVREGYAVMDERGMVQISQAGNVMLSKASGRITSLPEGEMVLFDRDSTGYTHNKR